MKQKHKNPAQISLDGFDEFQDESSDSKYLLESDGPDPRDNYLLAIYPPPEVAVQIHRLIDADRKHFGLTAPARPQHVLHATLCLLRDERCLRPAQRVAEVASASPFDVTFDCTLSFVKGESDTAAKKPYVLGCQPRSNQALHLLQRQLHVPLLRMGMLHRKSFVPHVTMLYDTKTVTRQAIEPIRWRVSKIGLVHGHYTKTFHEEVWSRSLAH